MFAPRYVLLVAPLICLLGWGVSRLVAADAPAPDEQTIRKLVEQLGDDRFAKREAAVKELEKIGRPALPQLRKAARESRDPEVQRRAAGLIRAIARADLVAVRTFDAAPLRGARRWVSRIVVTPDGKKAVTAGDECLILWDVMMGKVVRTFAPFPKAYWSLALSGDGRRVIAGGDGGAAGVWDVESGKEVCRLEGHKGDVWGAALSADGKRAVTGAYDGSIRVWDAESGKQLRTFEGVTGKVRCLALSPDGKIAASGHFSDRDPSGIVYLWNVETGKQLHACKGHLREVSVVAFAPDGKTVLSAGFDGTMILWETAGGRKVRDFKGHASRIEGAAFADGGRLVLSCGDETDATLRVWDTDSGQELSRSEPLANGLLCVTVLPDGRQVLTTGKDSRVRLWRLGK